MAATATAYTALSEHLICHHGEPLNTNATSAHFTMCVVACLVLFLYGIWVGCIMLLVRLRGCAGESFAGQYIPMLTREVVEGNKKGMKPFINIKVCARQLRGSHKLSLNRMDTHSGCDEASAARDPEVHQGVCYTLPPAALSKKGPFINDVLANTCFPHCRVT